MLQGGNLEVNRASANRTGWKSIMERFMISKSPNNVRIMKKTIMSYDDPTNMH
jgi:hypothetical protein